MAFTFAPKNISNFQYHDYKSGTAWLYNQSNITYDDVNGVLYNSDGMTANWSSPTKNISNWSYQTKN